MSATPDRPRAEPPRTDLVPLADRLRYLRMLRAVLAATLVADALLLAPSMQASTTVVALGALAYLAACLAAEQVWRSRQHPARGPVGSLLVLDGVFLAWASYVVGAPARALVFVHLGSAALLASHRTALRLAGWHSVLQLGVFYAHQAALLDAAGRAVRSDLRQVVAFVAGFWVLTLAISALSAVNERELRRRRLEMDSLARMGRALQEVSGQQAVGEVLLRSVCDTFRFPRAALFDCSGPAFRLVTCRGLTDAVVADLSLTRGSVLTRVLEERSTVVAPSLDPGADPWLDALLPRARHVIVMPLVADSMIGVLVVDAGTGRVPDRRLVAVAERFAGHAALAMRNAALLERVQQLAVTDALTALANRRSFDRALERGLALAERSEGRLSIVLLDIDHFKALNDTHGHLVGDQVLRQVAAVLQECGREYDTVARYGGEEFSVVLPGCSSAVAERVAERLRRAVEEAPTQVGVTASAGVATYPTDGRSADELIGAADQALYAAKRAGRNRVVTAQRAREVRSTATG